MIQLTKEEIDAIKEEAERLYPEPIYGTAIWAEAGWTIKRRAYIAGATSERLKAKELVANIQHHLDTWPEEMGRCMRLVQKEIDAYTIKL